MNCPWANCPVNLKTCDIARSIRGSWMFCFGEARMTCCLTISYSPSHTRSERGTPSEPSHSSFYFILDLEDSEKLGVTFRTHSFLLENLKKVLKNHHFLENLENLYSLMVLAKYYWTGYIFIPNESSFSIEFKYTFIFFLEQW